MASPVKVGGTGQCHDDVELPANQGLVAPEEAQNASPASAVLSIDRFQANHGHAQVGHGPPYIATHERREQHSSLGFTVTIHFIFTGGFFEPLHSAW